MNANPPLLSLSPADAPSAGTSTETSTAPFKCDLCNQTFASQFSRNMHRVRLHKIKLDGTPAGYAKPKTHATKQQTKAQQQKKYRHYMLDRARLGLPLPKSFQKYAKQPMSNTERVSIAGKARWAKQRQRNSEPALKRHYTKRTPPINPVAATQTDTINHCPNCGLNLVPYRMAAQLNQKLQG